MRAVIHSFAAQQIGRLVIGSVLLTSFGCAMFEDDNQPKYTRNSPSSVTRHAPSQSNDAKDADPNDFLKRPRPQP